MKSFLFLFFRVPLLKYSIKFPLRRRLSDTIVCTIEHRIISSNQKTAKNLNCDRHMLMFFFVFYSP